MQPRLRTLEEYVDEKGKNPFRIWFDSLKNPQTQAIIDARLARVRLGNFGHCRSVGDGVNELKVDIGPGYRVYFAQEGATLVILLTGGDKKTQAKDILKAKLYWNDHQRS